MLTPLFRLQIRFLTRIVSHFTWGRLAHVGRLNNMLCVLLIMLTGKVWAENMTREVLIDTRDTEGSSAAFHQPARDDHAEGLSSVPLPLIIRVTGYGIYDSKAKNSASKRLQAIRASRLDAYRNLAERVYGYSVSGTSSVKDFMLQSDQFATSVDSVVRGARVVSIADNPETGIETVVELELPVGFQNCLNKVNNFKHRMDCLRPITTAGLAAPSAESIESKSREPRMRSLYHLN